MTRDDHIRAAETLLGSTPGCGCGHCLRLPVEPPPADVARAQVHALLALALSQPEVTR